MAKEVTAYVSADGKIHLDKDEADYADFSGEISTDVGDFLKVEKSEDKDGHIAKLIIRWERWKHGDFAGWLESRRKPDGVVLVCGSELTPKPKDWVGQILAAKPKTAVVEAPKAYKKKVGIVGVWPGNQGVLKKEFGEIFDLAIFSADEDSKLKGLANYHKVFVVKKFVSHRHTEILRSIGQEPMIIGGAMNELKAALTSYAQSQ